MDWFSWLSKTNLNPSLVYDYGLTFTRNELQLHDSIHFNHEFLQSMGISIAKHRLEILNLVKNQNQQGPKNTNNLSKVIKKYLKKCLRNLTIFNKEKEAKDTDTDTNTNRKTMSLQQEQNWYKGKWRRALVNEELKGMHRQSNMAMSGPLDGRMINNEKMVIRDKKMLKYSGPLDGKMNERKMLYTNRSPVRKSPIDGRFMDTTRSPRFSGPISPIDFQSPYKMTRDDYDFEDSVLWRALFEDLQPT